MQQTTIRGAKLAWEDSGEGLPVVLLHPFPLSRTAWNEQRLKLSKHFRILTPDFRGFGDSELDAPAITMDDLADDVRVLLDELKLYRVILGGLSMGGYVSFAFYRKYPRRVRGLILANTRPQADDEQGKQAREELAGMAEQKGSGAVGTHMIPRLFGDSTFRLNPHVPIATWRKIDAARPEAIAAAARGMAQRKDSTAVLPQINCPVLLIAGEQDPLIPPSIAEQMEKAIPDARLELLQDAGHLSNLEKPVEFTEIVKDFLDEFPV
jgi:pimeloyl-ACP methyl ester carboxylesterase